MYKRQSSLLALCDELILGLHRRKCCSDLGQMLLQQGNLRGVGLVLCCLLYTSSIDAGGTIVQVLQEDYVRVRWNSSRVATTHRRHALEYAGSH